MMLEAQQHDYCRIHELLDLVLALAYPLNHYLYDNNNLNLNQFLNLLFILVAVNLHCFYSRSSGSLWSRLRLPSLAVLGLFIVWNVFPFDEMFLPKLLAAFFRPGELHLTMEYVSGPPPF